MFEFHDVFQKLDKKNLILFTKESSSLTSLIHNFDDLTHVEAIYWAFLQVDRIASSFHNNQEIDDAISLCKLWAKGEIKMSAPKKAILALHALAKSSTDLYEIARFHAIGQGLSTVHVKTHALGLIFYELTSLVRKHGKASFMKPVTSQIQAYQNDMILAKKQANLNTWATFLKDKSDQF